jgi:hypothetical protein
MQPAIHVEYNDDRSSAPIIEIPEDIPTPEAIRRTHIVSEANIKGLGQLVLLGVVLESVNLVRSLGAADSSPAGAGLLLSVAWLVAAALCGFWLRALEPKGRLLFTVLSIVQLVTVAFELHAAGALLAATRATLNSTTVMALVLLLMRLTFLYILWNRKGRMVLSRHYRHEIIPATPGIEYRSRAPWLILLGVVLVIAAVIALAIVSA